MEAYQALKEAAKASDIPLYRIGRELGKPDAYVNSAISRGSVPRCDTMAMMAKVCGYELAIVPDRDIPASAFIIDYDVAK